MIEYTFEVKGRPSKELLQQLAEAGAESDWFDYNLVLSIRAEFKGFMVGNRQVLTRHEVEISMFDIVDYAIKKMEAETRNYLRKDPTLCHLDTDKLTFDDYGSWSLMLYKNEPGEQE